MKASVYISSRLRIAGDNTSKSPSTIIAIVGVAVSVVVMILSVSVVSGFKNEIKSKVIGFGSEVTLQAANISDDEEIPILNLSPQLRSVIESIDMFDSPELSITQPAIIKTTSDFEGIVVQGIENGRMYDFIRDNIEYGEVDNFHSSSKNCIIISRHTADRLRLDTADRIDVAYVIDGKVRLRRYTVDAIYNTHFSDYDKMQAYVPLHALQQLHGVDSLSATRIDLYLQSIGAHSSDEIDVAAERLRSAMIFAVYNDSLPGIYQLSTINQTGAVYFNWLSLLDTNIVVILIIMAAVAGFTLISSLFIIILQRVRTIGILKVLGASTSFIRQIFILLGWRLVIYGILAGDIISVSFMLVQAKFHILPLDPEAYYLNYVPVNLDIMPVVIINIAVFLFSWLLLLIPSRTIASISPAATVRYE
ncbi:MAG: ABC transporter permease [Muribaculum sp.]|nr:ABC transporter permease [Muribaculum sp.]